MAATALLIKPSLEEVLLQSAKIGLPEIEGEKFFLHYQSNGWKVGRVPMKCFPSALAGWKLRWMERHAHQQQREGQRSNGANVMLKSREYERIIEKMKSISSTYAQHQSWEQEDKLEWRRLKVRRDALRLELGIVA